LPKKLYVGSGGCGERLLNRSEGREKKKTKNQYLL
jgi:hypothetical protein